MSELDKLVAEWANCRFAEVDGDGEVWIEDPQRGHWLDPAELARLDEFLARHHQRRPGRTAL